MDQKYINYVNKIKDFINRDILLKEGYISQKDEPLTQEIINKLAYDLGYTTIYTNGMTLTHVKEIYRNLLVEFSGIDTRVPEVFTLENKIKTCNINIPGLLTCKFDIEQPIFLAGYKIATIYELTYRGENILSKKPIQLYKSTGTSRIRETGGDSTVGIWLPFSGRESKIKGLKKPEDSLYGYALERIKQNIYIYKGIMAKDFNDLLPHFKHLLKYKRFMDKDYAISSYLLSLYEYEPLEKTEEEKALDEKEGNEAFSKFNPFFGWVEPSKHKFYYEKYLKYKQKYIQLKSAMN
jgi:hypothetical protein